MKIWRLDISDPYEGTIVSWHSSKRKAKAECARLRHELGSDMVFIQDVRPVEIPTNRSGLVHWLNKHFNRDNG